MAGLINNCDNCLKVYVDDCATSITLPDVDLANSTDYNIVLTDKHGNEYDLTGTTTAGGILTVDISSLVEGLINKYGGCVELEIYDNSGYFTTDNLITLVYGDTQYQCVTVCVTPDTDEDDCDNLAIAPIVEIFADDTVVTAGQTVRLGWIGLNGETVSINQGIGTVPKTGYQDVVINVTTTFTATITNSAGTDTDSITITVDAGCADATAVIKNTLGTVIDTEAIPSGASEDITIANVSWTDSDGSAESTPYGVAIVCTAGATTLAPTISADDTTPDTNQTVTFTGGCSNGTPTNWLWSFGDGTTSTLQNPTHVYTAAGTYTVTLSVTDGSNDGVLINTNYIIVTLQAPVGTPYAWYKAASGVSPANMTLVSGVVSEWQDGSGNNFHVTQGTAANRPAYTDNLLNGYGGVTFDGINDVITRNDAAMSRPAVQTIFLVMKRLESGANNDHYSCSFSSNSGTALYTDQWQGFRGYNGGATMVNYYPTLLSDNFILTYVQNGANSLCWINDVVPIQTSTTSTNTSTGIVLGGNASLASNPNFILYEAIVFNSALSTLQIQANIQYFQSKFDLHSEL